jgi:ADP-ribose pyrophosphatase
LVRLDRVNSHGTSTVSGEPSITIRPWTLRHRELAFAARPWVELYTDTWEMPDGRVRGNFQRIVLPSFAIVVPVTADRRFVMIREYKPGVDRVSLNTPAGGLAQGEAPLDGARRELLEETGYTTERWQALGSFVVDGNAGCGRANLFLARDVVRVAAPRLDETEEIEVVLLDEAALRAALKAGEFTMLPAAAAIGLALLALSD